MHVASPSIRFFAFATETPSHQAHHARDGYIQPHQNNDDNNKTTDNNQVHDGIGEPLSNFNHSILAVSIMPFLLPAVVAALSDVLILVVQEHREESELLISQFRNDGSGDNYNAATDDGTDGASLLAVHHVQYLVLAAVLRLLLLLFPLPYHSWSGTAIRCCFLYQLFYGLTLIAVLSHMLALSMIDPDSIATLVTSGGTSTGTSTGSSSQSTADQASLSLYSVHQQLSRSCWWILLLSLLSVLAHIVMLIHVRSTAPSVEYMPYHSIGNRKKKMVYYYASRRQTTSMANTTTGTTPTQLEQALRSVSVTGDHPITASAYGEKDLERQKYSSSQEERGVDPLLLAPPNRNSDDCPTSPIQKLSSQYDDFVSEMQFRISHLKKDWTHKLDDFTQRHLNITGINEATNNRSIMGHPAHNNPLLPLTPFRVLLQLFAYQDVIDSGKLDAVFDMDQGQSLAFFVPQLLSFLLHGAYYEADPTKLEAWILDKCSSHVHFAHQCYWFLRAWSLEQPIYQTSKTPTPTHSSLSLQETTRFDFNDTGTNNGSSKSGTQSSLVSPRTPAKQTTTTTTTTTTSGQQQPQRHSRSNSWSSLTGGGIHTNSSQKLLPEERAVVEDLMLRVVQCGEASARILQYGPPLENSTKGKNKRRGKRDKATAKKEETQEEVDSNKTTLTYNGAISVDSSDTNGLFWDDPEAENGGAANGLTKSPSYTLVPELALTPEKEASLPVDPSTGFPSQRHLETLTASHRFGFMPWATAKKQQEWIQSTATTTTTEPNTPSALSITDSFQATPRFLDALLAIADGLFLVPREQRKKQLRQQLQSLEVEMLPSNAVYVPISNTYHRVWRVVAEESIALNTKERVPCIILLEVVDYDSKTQNDAGGSNDGNETYDHPGALDGSVDSKLTKEKRPLELPKLELPKLGIAKKQNKRKSAADRNNASSESNASDLPELSSGAMSSAPLQFSLPYYTMMGGMTETEIVNHWRYARRDPHRGESMLDKMTSSLPLDIHRVKERIHQLRDKQGAIFQDLLSLTHTDDADMNSEIEGSQDGNDRNCPGTVASARDPDSEIAAFLCNDPYEGTRMLSNDEAMNHDSRDLSPERDPLDVSMGQWTSPVAEKPRISISVKEDTKSMDPQNRGVARNISYKRQDSREQDYGSTYEGRGQTSNVMDGRPPRQPGNGVSSTGLTPKNGTKKPPQQVVFRENWQAKEERLRPQSAFGDHPGWRLLPILVKANDDLRQEQLASQLIRRMAFILARERVPVWLCPYEIIAITDRGGIIEAIPDTISLDSLKRNDSNFVDLKTFFHSYFGDNVEDLVDAKSNFVESLAAYSIVCFLLQLKDRHNGNILLDNRGHLIHIDFGFFFLSSPGKNTGFESAPFKLTRDFVEVLGGPESHAFRTFRELCVRSFLVLRRHCMEIILLVEMLKSGNEDLPCFLGRPDDAIKGLKERFRLDLSDRACKEYVHSLIDESLGSWTTKLYDGYQRYCVGVL